MAQKVPFVKMTDKFEFNEDLNHKLMNFLVNYEFLRIYFALYSLHLQTFEQLSSYFPKYMNMEIDIQNSNVKSVEIDSKMLPLDSDMFSNVKCEMISETALIVKKEIPEYDFSSESEKNEAQKIDAF